VEEHNPRLIEEVCGGWVLGCLPFRPGGWRELVQDLTRIKLSPVLEYIRRQTGA